MKLSLCRTPAAAVPVNGISRNEAPSDVFLSIKSPHRHRIHKTSEIMKMLEFCDFAFAGKECVALHGLGP